MARRRRLRLWRISQSVNDDWETYSAAVVAAYTAGEARKIHPNGRDTVPNGSGPDYSWTNDPDNVQVELLGLVADGSGIKADTVIVSSFHAG